MAHACKLFSHETTTSVFVEHLPLTLRSMFSEIHRWPCHLQMWPGCRQETHRKPTERDTCSTGKWSGTMDGFRTGTRIPLISGDYRFLKPVIRARADSSSRLLGNVVVSIDRLGLGRVRSLVGHWEVRARYRERFRAVGKCLEASLFLRLTWVYPSLIPDTVVIHTPTHTPRAHQERTSESSQKRPPLINEVS